MHRTFTTAALALAALAVAACQAPAEAPPAPEPATYALTYDSLTGDRYVLDTGLTMNDCLLAMDGATATHKRGIGCEIERKESGKTA